jgi:H+/Cl- antiporter ClcA
MNSSNHNTTYNTLFHWNSFKFKLIFESVIVGILTGLVVVLYRYLLEKSLILVKKTYILMSKDYLLLLPWIIALVIIGYIVGLLVKNEPMISGSGIPQVEGVLLRKLNMNWLKVILGKFIGGVLAIGSGLSLGREGPSVQLGASIGLGFAKIFKRLKIEENFLITSGASAGLATAFNAPLAGVMFSLEETHKNFSPLILLSTLSAALSADFISSEFFGLKPVFNFKSLVPLSLNYYFYIVILGALVGVLGVVFNKVLLKTQDLYSSQRWLSIEFRPIVPLLISIPLGLLLPQILGGGNDLIMSMVKNPFTINLLIILLVIKFLFTMVCYGSGAPGGIFLPLLTIGAIIGNIYACILVSMFHFNSIYVNNFIILAMAGYFTAVVRAPITGSILITEMTGSFNHLLPLALVSIVAYMIADILNSNPIYESLLERFLKRTNNNDTPMEYTKGKALLEVAVCMGSTLDGKKIKELKWPDSCLLVAIKRGEKEIIPKGNTLIYPGDYLIVLADEYKASKVSELLLSMANASM